MVRKSPFLSKLLKVHSTLLIGQLLMAVIVALLWQLDIITSFSRELDRVLQVVAILISGTALFLGARIFRQRIERARDMLGSAAEKITIYQSACLLQWSLLSGASLFCIISFLLVGNLSFLLLALTLLFFFFLSRPSKIKLLLLLRLNEHEIEDLSL